MKEKALLARAEEQAEAPAAQVRVLEGLGRLCEAGADVRAAIQRGVEALAAEAVSQAQALAGRAERHLEDAFCRASAMAASTRALSRVRARRRSAWDVELRCLLEALREVEELTGQLGERQKGEEAALRHAVSRDLREGFAALKGSLHMWARRRQMGRRSQEVL